VLRDACQELQELEGLHDVAVGADLIGPPLGVIGGRHDDDGRCDPARPKRRGEFPAVHTGHTHVEKDERRRASVALGKSLDTHAPMGPWAVTADLVGDFSQLEQVLMNLIDNGRKFGEDVEVAESEARPCREIRCERPHERRMRAKQRLPGCDATASGERCPDETVDDLGKLVLAKVQSVPGITRTLTCPVVHL